LWFTQRKSSTQKKSGIQTNMYIIMLFLYSFSCSILHFLPTATSSFVLHKASHFFQLQVTLYTPLSLSHTHCLFLNSWIDQTNVFNLHVNLVVYLMDWSNIILSFILLGENTFILFLTNTRWEYSFHVLKSFTYFLSFH